MALPFTTAGEVNRIVDNKIAAIPQPQAEVLYEHALSFQTDDNGVIEITFENELDIKEGDLIHIQFTAETQGQVISKFIRIVGSTFPDYSSFKEILFPAQGTFETQWLDGFLTTTKLSLTVYEGEDGAAGEDFLNFLIEKLPY